jgi:transposase-like protein
MTKFAERMQRYQAGHCDAQMAMAEGITVDGIRTWRRRFNLPVNHVTSPVDRRRIKSMTHTERLRLYRSGLNDRDIARRLNTTRSAIVQWRGAHSLPSKYQPDAPRALRKPVRDEQMMRLYRLGRTDREMAASLGCAQRIVYRWRHGLALERNDENPSVHGAVRLVSIDADLGEGGFNRHGLIADDAASEWLEENGATKW